MSHNEWWPEKSLWILNRWYVRSPAKKIKIRSKDKNRHAGGLCPLYIKIIEEKNQSMVMVNNVKAEWYNIINCQNRDVSTTITWYYNVRTEWNNNQMVLQIMLEFLGRGGGRSRNFTIAYVVSRARGKGRRPDLRPAPLCPEHTWVRGG